MDGPILLVNFESDVSAILALSRGTRLLLVRAYVLAIATATAIAAQNPLSCMEHSSDVISLLEQTKMLMAQCYWIPF